MNLVEILGLFHTQSQRETGMKITDSSRQATNYCKIHVRHCDELLKIYGSADDLVLFQF